MTLAANVFDLYTQMVQHILMQLAGLFLLMLVGGVTLALIYIPLNYY